MLRIAERQDDFVAVEASGRLRREDYERVLPQLEGMLKDHEKIRMLVVLDEFKGWRPSAFIEDLKFNFKHRRHFERTAVVGGRTVERVATDLTKPFFMGEMRFFDTAHLTEAREWVLEGQRPGGGPPEEKEEKTDWVDEASEESFPASDPPGYTPSSA